ncbi:hypothetical protein BDV27DRAFT_140200 [Aspergillus caelatus]|uniref:Amino acid permease-domain-containing protein n=1 Tax=Aspergillus caelatus TaxID=61420 RepID=A0A5N7AL60_9EURO|nr:uncharacterized protein BDV27DRAFT_140200 [Aspergillus caelatus]KAE8370581.1 hypothetical protein BDV27DRAFT_140200 [Aspergillus caelatus]
MEPSSALDHSPYRGRAVVNIEYKSKHLITTPEENSVQIVNQDAPFSFLGALDMNFTITAAPISIGSFLALTIGLGGPPFFFYGFLFTGLGQLVLCLAAAEIASSMPHPLAVLRATFSASIPQHASHSEPWHHFLVYVGVCVNALVVNLPKCRKIMDWSLSASLVFVNGSALFILIALLVRANPKQSAAAVFVNIANDSGWGSTAVVFFLNVMPGLAGLEELKLPTRDMPRVMVGSALLNYLVAIPTMIIYLFCIVNPQAMLSPVGGQPLIQLLSDGYASRALTAIAGALIVVSFTNRLLGSLGKLESVVLHPCQRSDLRHCFDYRNWSHTTWVNYCSKRSARRGKSVLWLSWIIVFTFRRWLNLGKWGRPLSVIAIIWCMWTITWASFPLFLHVTLSSMNWSALVAAGVVVVSIIYYILFYRHNRDERG